MTWKIVQSRSYVGVGEGVLMTGRVLTRENHGHNMSDMKYDQDSFSAMNCLSGNE